MDVYISFTDKEHEKIDAWKKELPKVEEGTKRNFSISLLAQEGVPRNEDDRMLFKAIFKSNDGYKLTITKKCVMHQ